jgi:hypothetical protein
MRSLLLTLACCVVVASADSIVERGFYDQLSANSAGGLSISGLLDVTPFDLSLGHLNSTTIDWTFDVSSQEYYFTNAPNPTFGIPYTLTWTATATVGPPEPGIGLPFTPQENVFSDTVTHTGSGTFDSLGYLNDTVGNPFTISGEAVFASPAYTTLFTGGGLPYEIFLSTAFDLQEDSASSDLSFLPLGFRDIGNVNGGPLDVQATVTFDYTPVPEPRGGIALLAVALLTMLWRSARRRSQAVER